MALHVHGRCSQHIRTVTLLICVPLAPAVGQSQQPQPETVDLEFIVAAHVRSQRRVAAVSLNLELVALKTRIPTNDGAIRFASWSWAMHNHVELIRYTQYGIAGEKAGKVTRIGEEYRDGTQTWSLRNWDPKSAVPIPGPGQTDVRAEVSPQTRRINCSQDPAVYLLQAISIPLAGDQRWYLDEFIAKSPDAELVGEVEIDGVKNWQIRAVHPGKLGLEPDGTYCEIFIEPSSDYCIRKIIEHDSHSDDSAEDKASETRLSVAVREVTAFRKLPGGVFFPVETELRVYQGEDDPPVSIVRATVETVKINDDVAADAVAFVIPENVIVTHMPPGDNGMYRREVWGPDNKSIFEFSDVRELDEWQKQRQATGESRQGTGSRWFLWIANGVVLCVVAALLLRNWRKTGRSDE